MINKGWSCAVRMRVFQSLLLQSQRANSGCLLWSGGVNSRGYGKARLLSGQEVVLVHRAMYACWHGSILEGNEIFHVCDSKLCIEPTHLLAASRKEACLSLIYPTRGERVGSAKMTENKVRALRKEFARGVYRVSELARIYGISRKTAAYIIERRYWKHVA